MRFACCHCGDNEDLIERQVIVDGAVHTVIECKECMMELTQGCIVNSNIHICGSRTLKCNKPDEDFDAFAPADQD